jgi:hypothetical protein
MSNFSLYHRMRSFGTLSETPEDIPDVLYALPSTVNWMKALALVTKDLKVTFQSGRAFYSKVQVRKPSDQELNTAYEQLLFGLNQIASLRAMATVQNKADVARMGIVAWYYAVYGSASAMIAVADGSFQETHAATANQWDQIFAVKGMAMPPFGDRLSNLLNETIEQELVSIRARGKHSLTTVPGDAKQGWGCIAEYISGSAKWEQWNIEQRVRNQAEFKKLGVDNFRTKAARDIRDKAYAKVSVSFLHQAFRYRGKANYRDAIFLAYGNGVPTIVAGMIDDLADVATAFSAMAAAYVSVRIGKDLWLPFIEDIEKKRSVSVAPKSVWS